MVKYTRVTRINAGGQGEVWKGTADDGTDVAIKYMFLNGSAAQQAEDLRRFQREITCQTSLSHPGILPIYGWDLTATEPHFAMPIATNSLRDVLEALRPTGAGMSETAAVQTFDQVLEAIEYAHGEGVIHRDLKPENVLFFGGRPVIADFGLGRRMFTGSTTLTVTNAAMGTFAYSAPEQFSDAHSADQRSDVFALGRIFYEMLTNRMSIAGQDLNLVPAQYRFVINKATQTEPDRRFQSVNEMRRELALLASSPANLLAPAERAAILATAVASGDRSKIDELGRVLLENGDDLQLYVQIVPTIPETVLANLALSDPDQFHQIMQIFDRYADGGFSFEYTDTIAVFLSAVYRSTNDFRVHELVLERLLKLGYSHNRWFVRDRFVEVVRMAIVQPHYAPMVAGVLRRNASAIPFVRDTLTQLSLPQVVLDELMAA